MSGLPVGEGVTLAFSASVALEGEVKGTSSLWRFSVISSDPLLVGMMTLDLSVVVMVYSCNLPLWLVGFVKL